MGDILEKDPRETNLPKWAQVSLDRLRTAVATERRRADEARLALGGLDSNTVIDPYDPIPLPPGQEVRLGTPSGWVDVRVDGDRTFRVISGSALRVLPLAANHILLEVPK